MSDCIFCKIIEGTIPAEIVYQDDAAVAFRDINPQAPVHILVVPRKHCKNIVEAAGIPGMMEQMTKAIAAISKQYSLEEDGFRVIANTGIRAGQSVFHLHLHILAGKDMGDKLC